MKGPQYREWEIQVIRDLYPDIPEIRRRLPDRPASSIKYKAGQLGVTSPLAPEWNLEVKTITGLHPDIDAICRALPNRTRAAIVKRAKLLGIARRVKKWTPERLEILGAMFGTLSDKEVGEIFGASTRAVAAQRIKMRLLHPVAEVNKAARLRLVQDIRSEAAKRGIRLKKITKALGCPPLNPSVNSLMWGRVSKVVDALGGELYVTWDE